MGTNHNLKFRYLIILLLFILSCKKNDSFNSEKWKEKGLDWQLGDTRERMLKDLIESDTIIGLQESEIKILLGEPETSDDKRLKYLIREKYKWNIDPEYIKYLWIDLDQNGKAIKTYIEQTK